MAVGGFHLQVDETRHVEIERARPGLVSRNQAIAGRIDEGHFLGREISRHIGRRPGRRSPGGPGLADGEGSADRHGGNEADEPLDEGTT
jgi:hypothetical protein